MQADPQGELEAALLELRASLSQEPSDDATARANEREVDLQLKEAELERKKQAHGQRKEYSKVAVRMAMAWMVFGAAVVTWQGLINPDRRLPSDVLVALLVASLGNVLGLFAIVLNGLFGSSDT